MDTIDEVDGRRRRRKHSAEFKATVISACRRPGVSIAAVALANKLNANLLRTWVVAAERGDGHKPSRAATQVVAMPVSANRKTAGFIPLQVGTPLAVNADRNITIELRRGATTIKVEWPVSAAAECTAWLRDVMR